jgi:hypothetical protein
MRARRTASAATQRGQVATDWLLLVGLVALALSIGADGPIAQLVDAIGERYGRFTWAVSLP